MEVKEQNSKDLPKDLKELYGIFTGTEAPDKKELRRIFHEKTVKAITPEELLVIYNNQNTPNN